MTDVHNKATRSFNMSQIKSKDTKPELLVRKFLHTNGFRFRLHDKTISGKPVFNPGQLPNELELSDLSIAHGSYPHNPLLANCMFLTGDIERYGTGTLEIFHLLKEAHLSCPQFNVEESFKVILYMPWSQTIHDTIHDTIHESNYFALENLTHRQNLLELIRVNYLWRVLSLSSKGAF
jgi:hypothetical protein